MKINVKAFGLACGLVWGFCAFLLGIINIFACWGDAWVKLMSSMYIGYNQTILGSIIGGLWGFADAGIGGLVIAWLYNKFAQK